MSRRSVSLWKSSRQACWYWSIARGSNRESSSTSRRPRGRPHQDRRRARVVDCRLPRVVTSMLGFDASVLSDDALNVQVQLALSMRRHGRGGICWSAPGPAARNGAIRFVQPIALCRGTGVPRLLAELLASHGSVPDHEWWKRPDAPSTQSPGSTAVDGATVVTSRYELLAFGEHRRGRARRSSSTSSSPSRFRAGTAERMHPGQLGGTRHLSAAQFVRRPARRRRAGRRRQDRPVSTDLRLVPVPRSRPRASRRDAAAKSAALSIG